MKERAYVVAVILGLGALLVLAVAVLQFGRYDPSPPSLQDHPNASIPGKIAWWDKDACLVVGEASGASRKQVSCPSGPYGGGVPLRWDDANTLSYLEYTGPTPQRVTVNVATGQISRVPDPDPGKDVYAYQGIAPDGTRATVDENGTVWVTESDGNRKVADFDVAKHHGPGVTTWSPDSRWMVLLYNRPRGDSMDYEIWLLSRDGTVSGTLVEHARDWGGVAWWIEGVGGWPKR
ncbi:MAG: hypothetical protein IT302_10125 [Dehalococcoidia bacterium]|nr:hypothetical protein [Dehalococcoidia bacterium]